VTVLDFNGLAVLRNQGAPQVQVVLAAAAIKLQKVIGVGGEVERVAGVRKLREKNKKAPVRAVAQLIAFVIRADISAKGAACRRTFTASNPKFISALTSPA
jgi:hypothetical protein